MKTPKEKLGYAIKLDVVSMLLANIISVLGIYLTLHLKSLISNFIPPMIFRVLVGIVIVVLLTKGTRYITSIKIVYTLYFAVLAIALFRLAYFSRYITEYSPELIDYIIVGYSPELLIHGISGLAVLFHVVCSARLVYLCWKNEGVRDYIKEQNGKQ